VTSELQEADWNRLLRRIQSGKCTPFLGAGACYGALPLGTDVAEELAQRYAYPFPDRDLVRVAQYAAIQSDPNAVAYLDSGAPPQCSIKIVDADDFKVIPETMYGKNSILLSDGFQPSSIAFGPANDQLTLTSWSGVQFLDLRDGTPKTFSATFRDQFMRMLPGPRCNTSRLVATSLYGRIKLTQAALSQKVPAQSQYPTEPVVFRGSIGMPQFSPDGQRMLIVSGGIWNVFDSMRLIDVTPLCRTWKPVPKDFEPKPAPPWLADIASAVSALDTSDDGSLTTLEAVRQKYPRSKAGNPYEAVWRRFFPDESVPIKR
jgi:hypothetical protein